MLSLAIALFLIGAIIQYSGNFHVFKFTVLDKLCTTIYIYRNFLFLGLPFFIIGYLININDWQRKVTSTKVAYGIAISSAFLLIESYISYYFTKEPMDNLFSLILICPMIFIYILNTKINCNVNSKNISLIATAMYLIHPWVIYILIKTHPLNSVLLAVFTIIISFAISLVLLKINNKVKFLL